MKLQARDFKDAEVHHRHLSHLFGLFPGHTITIDEDLELCKAAEKTLYRRGLSTLNYWNDCFGPAVSIHLWSSDFALIFSSVQQEKKVQDGQLHGKSLYGHVYTTVSMLIR